MLKAVLNVDPGLWGAIHDQDLVQKIYETVPHSLYDMYQLLIFISYFFDKSPCPSSTIYGLLSPNFPDFIAQMSGMSGSTFKSFLRYPVTENVDHTFEGRFCIFNTFHFCGLAVKFVDKLGDLQKEVFLTNIASRNMRRCMGVAVKDDEKAITETHKPFFNSFVAIGSQTLKCCLFHSAPLPCTFCSLVHPKFFGKPIDD